MQRHLVYHVYAPKGNDVWRRNVRQLLKRWKIFTGRKLIGVAIDEGTESLETVKEEFGREAEFFPLTNDRTKRDGLTLAALLPKLQGESGSTFFAHTKGVSTICNPRGAARWRNAMYNVLLDGLQIVERQMNGALCYGTHKKTKRDDKLEFPSGRNTAWHFAGGFWWVRNDALFARDWQRPLLEDNDGWLAETFLPSLFTSEEAFCPAYAWNDQNIYDHAMYHECYDDEQPLATDGFTVGNLNRKLNLGCGGDIREGWANVDLDRRADIQCDLAAIGRGETKLPFPDNHFDYTLLAHTLEHIYPYHGLLHEICRVTRLTGGVEIVVPHYGHQMAMCQGHLHVVSPLQVDHWCNTAIPYWFGGQPKRLYPMHTIRKPSQYYPRAKALFPQFDDNDLFAFIPNTCDEIKYQFVVGVNREAPAPIDVILNTSGGQTLTSCPTIGQPQLPNTSASFAPSGSANTV